MTIRQVLSKSDSNMIRCIILDKNDNFVMEDTAQNIVRSEFEKAVIDSEILAWDVQDGKIRIWSVL